MLSFIFLFALAAADCDMKDLKFEIDQKAENGAPKAISCKEKIEIMTDKSNGNWLGDTSLKNDEVCGQIKSKIYDCGEVSVKCKKDKDELEPNLVKCTTKQKEVKFKALTDQAPMQNCKTIEGTKCLNKFYYENTDGKLYIISGGCTTLDYTAYAGKKWCGLKGGKDSPVKNLGKDYEDKPDGAKSWGECKDDCPQAQEADYTPPTKLETQISATKLLSNLNHYSFVGGVAVTIFIAIIVYTLYRRCQKPADEYVALMDEQSEI